MDKLVAPFTLVLHHGSTTLSPGGSWMGDRPPTAMLEYSGEPKWMAWARAVAPYARDEMWRDAIPVSVEGWVSRSPSGCVTYSGNPRYLKVRHIEDPGTGRSWYSVSGYSYPAPPVSDRMSMVVVVSPI